MHLIKMIASSESFADEIDFIKSLGLTHIAVVYALGHARAVTNLKLPVLAKVLKDLPRTGISDCQLLRVSSILHTGNLAETKAVVNSIIKEQSEEQPEYQQSFSRSKDSELSLQSYVCSSPSLLSSSEYPEGSCSDFQVPKISQSYVATDDLLAKLFEATRVVECTPLLGPDNAELNCFICKQPIHEEDFIPLDGCGHILHPDCTFEHVMSQIRASVFPITCPISNCQDEISHINVKEVLDEEAFALYTEASFNAYLREGDHDIIKCFTPGCSFVFVWTGEGPEFECPMCSMSYCISCKTPWHHHTTCKQNLKQVNKEAKARAENSDALQCPVCISFEVIKIGVSQAECKCGYFYCTKCLEPCEECRCRRLRPRKRSIIGSMSNMFKSIFM